MEAKRLTSFSWCVRPPPFFCLVLDITLTWSPSGDWGSVRGWMWRVEESGWMVVSESGIESSFWFYLHIRIDGISAL